MPETETVNKKFDALEAVVGNTPLLEISFLYKGRKRKIFAKYEAMNLSGSIKDRVAAYILKKAYSESKINSSDIIAEATSGNTGISFSAIGTYLGHRVIIYMPDWMSKERIKLMESYGAEVRLVSKEEGGFLGSIKKTEELYKQGCVFLPCQFSNEDNSEAHYMTTGAEIAAQLKKLGLTADAFVAGVGTGGTVMGIGKRLKEVNPDCRVHPLEPKNSPTLSTGYKVGMHRIQGISDEFIPPIVRLNELDEVVSVDDVDAIIMSQLLSRKLGIGVGISSGANFLGCVLAQELQSEDITAVTVFADDNKKYLSTDYVEEHKMLDGYLTKDIELLDFVSYNV